MVVSTQLTVWPTTAVTLREILNVDSGPELKCHTQTKKMKRCTYPISKENSERISVLLEQIAVKGSLKAARAILAQLSQLVLCRHYKHQEDGPKFLSQWEKKLENAEQPVEGVKAEEPRESEKHIPGSSIVAIKEEVDIYAQEISLISIPKIKIEDEHLNDSEGESEQDTTSLSVSTATSRRSSLSSATIPISISSKELQRIGPKHIFERYCAQQTLLEINTKMKTYLLRKLPKKQQGGIAGLIYIYTLPSSYHDVQPLLKIGYTNDANQRMGQWERQCGYKPKELCRYNTEHYARTERLIHIQLSNFRKRVSGGCPTCGIKHREWFDVTETMASKTVAMWSSFMRKEPYDKEGELTKEWRDRLENVDLNDPKCWSDLVFGADKTDLHSGSDTSSLE